MGGRRRRSRVEPTDELRWEQLQILCAWPDQPAYEEIRPLTLFGSLAPVRARETGVGERELRGSGAVNQHVLVARSLLGLGHRGPDVGHIGDQRPLPHFAVGLAAAEDEDRHAVVVVAAPAARR